MEIQPMMPHPPAMRRRAHDLPDFPHLGHDLPDYVDPMDPPIYGDFADQNEMPDYQGNVGNWQRAPLHARGIDGPGVIIQDPRIRPQRPRHHHPRALRPDYNQLDNDLQRPAPQAIAAPRIDGPAVLDIVNPLENFYEQWRAEVQQRQGNGQPAPAQPRIPVVAPVPKGDAIADQNRGRVGRARANFHFLGNRRAHQPPDPVAQPVFRPNAVPVPEPANAHGNAQQRMRIVFHRPARPQNAEDLREPGAADALQRRINRLRESLAAREGRNAHNADVDFQARLVFEERRRRQVAGAAFGADVMEGVAQDVPAPENNAHDGAPRQDITRQRLQDPNDAVRQQRGLQEQGRPPGNHIERNLDRDMLEENRSPTPSSTPSKADAPAPPQPGGGLQEFLRELDVPARPQPVHEIERLLRELNRQRNDQRLAEQELANVQRGLDRAEAFANAVPLPPPGPNHYPRPNPWVGIYDYHGPEQLRMHQQLEQIAIANAPLNHNPNQILGHNPYLNQQPGHVVDYNRPPLRPLDHFNMPDPHIAPIHQQVHIDINNMPPVAPPVVRPNVGEILANAQAINQMHAQIVAQEQMVQAQAQAAAEAQARAEAQIQAVVQGQAMAQAGGIPVIPPPFPRHDMHDYVRQYAQEYHAGREANRAVDRAGAALGANIWEPVHPPVNPLLGEIPMDHLGRFDDAMRHVRQMRERLEGRIAQPVHVPEEIEEEYESDIGAADV
ncbi:hypothetical protein BKA65DRAFT_238521 [Rhexocercosporidium sp. MPI-PUGE-AT-0058]|nr:hypothetical protein BKA65DRAFT_238521 [Rhexocercosporidium sp. MPI-PUGE-AT-0058]